MIIILSSLSIYLSSSQNLGVDTDTFCMGHINNADTIDTSDLTTPTLVHIFSADCGTINNPVG